MRRLRFCALILLALTPTLRSRGSGAHTSAIETHVWIPMRDGVRLAANLYRPSDSGHFPTILVRTPYGKGAEITNLYQALIDRGYNVVAQDVRGRNDSEGTFAPLTQEPQDGDDTINWIAAQPWSDGKVGMTGGSYLGFAQWDVAVHNNPHLKAIFPVVAGDDDYRDRIYSPGGAMKWGHRLEWVAENMRAPGYVAPDFQKFIWTLPPRRADRVVTGTASNMLQSAFDHPSYDAFWKNISAREKLKDCKVPVFSVAGWYDNYAEGDLDAFAILHKRTGTNRIIVGPWPHNMSAPIKTVDFGPAAALPIRRMQMEWFDEWLKNKDVPLISAPPVRLFVMGADVWRDETEWPPARAIPTKLYLDSGGRANTLGGDGALTELPGHKSPDDHFTYDPRTPVPTMGGAVCCNPKVFPWGPMDQRKVEKRNDVLVYTSPPLREPVEVTGPISLVLYASTTAPDTDFTGKLIDVYPDGRAMNLTDGIVRARYRDGIEKPEMLSGKGPTKYTIDVGVTSNVFQKGHRIRLEVSSSNFPRFDRNPNTGRPIADETRLAPAAQTILHDARHKSYLLLPEIPTR
jgi:putative CocE/NonD family hydrolase